MATAKLTSAKKAAPKPVVQEIAKPAAPIQKKDKKGFFFVFGGFG